MPDPTETTLLTTDRFRVTEVQYPESPKKAVVRHPGAVAIIPLLPDGQVCLIANFRAATGRHLIEIPAGTLEPGEHADVTARRELAEETGYTANKWSEIAPPFYVSPGIMDERMYLFLAEDLTPGTPQREPGELIENRIVPMEQAIEMIRSGEICDAKTIVGLLTYKLLVS